VHIFVSVKSSLNSVPSSAGDQGDNGEAGRSHGEGEEETREFMDDIKLKILQCVVRGEREQRGGGDVAQHDVTDKIKNRETNFDSEGFLSGGNEIVVDDVFDNGVEYNQEDCLLGSSSEKESFDAEDESDVPRTDSEKSSADGENYPTWKNIQMYFQREHLLSQEEHRYEVFKIMKDYVRTIKRNKVLEILDDHVFEDEDSLEDAVFLVSEIIFNSK